MASTRRMAAAPAVLLLLLLLVATGTPAHPWFLTPDHLCSAILNNYLLWLHCRDGDDEDGGGPDVPVAEPQVQGHLPQQQQLRRRVPHRELPRRRVQHAPRRAQVLLQADLLSNTSPRDVLRWMLATGLEHPCHPLDLFVPTPSISVSFTLLLGMTENKVATCTLGIGCSSACMLFKCSWL
uniref:Uncharacterized protein n=1 Tax=Triticum urartu TaxID=4572 RepID=A0A8R7JUM3_TRIUA